MTEYLVLKVDDSDEGTPGSWHAIGRKQASSPARAIRLVDPGEGTYVAVPARSWKPLVVSVEQTTKITAG